MKDYPGVAVERAMKIQAEILEDGNNELTAFSGQRRSFIRESHSNRSI